MKRTISTLITVATLSLALAAGAANAMGDELEQLNRALKNELTQLGLPTDHLQDLTLADISAIRGMLNSEDGMGKVQGIKKILDKYDN